MTLSSLAEQQALDVEFNDYTDRLTKFPINNNLTLLCDTSLPFPRPFVPERSRKSIFDCLHNITHPGVKGSLKIIKQRYYWPDMDRCIRRWCAECIRCQEAKITRHTKAPVHSFELPSDRFQSVHIDLVGPLPPTKESSDMYTKPYKYLLTCIDRTTKWIEAIPLAEITASAVASAFLTGWISRFGVPLHVITDRGTQFEAELFSELSQLIGFHRLRTTSYHPQANGAIERVHRTIKTAITARKQSWLEALPIVLLGIRCMPNDSSFSPFTAVTGTTLLVPELIITEEQRNHNFSSEQVRSLASEMQKFTFTRYGQSNVHRPNPTFIPSKLSTCTHVWVRVDRVRRPLEAPYTGPFLVKDRSEKHFTIESLTGKLENVSIDRLKAAVLSSADPIVEPDVAVEPDTTDEPCTLEEPSQETEVVEPALQRPGKRQIIFRKDNDFYYY